MKKISNILNTSLVILTSTFWIGTCSANDLNHFGPMSVSPQGLVKTPYGEIPASDVFYVGPGEAIEIAANGHVVKTDKSTGKILKDYGKATDNAYYENHPMAYAKEIREEYLNKLKNKTSEANMIPELSKRNMSNNNTVSSGSGIKAEENEEKFNQYLVYSFINHIESFQTTMVVPEKPLINNKTFFIWEGLDRGVLQPVLVWREGGKNYYLQNWAFLGGKYYQGKWEYVNPGTTVTGVIHFIKRIKPAKDPNRFTYIVSFAGYPDIDLTANRATLADNIYECLEAYSGESLPPNDYIPLTQIKVVQSNKTTSPATLNWLGSGTSVEGLKGSAIIVTNDSGSDGAMNIYFH